MIPARCWLQRASMCAPGRKSDLGIPPKYLAVHTPCAGTVSAIEQRVHEAGGERRVLAVEITAAPDQESVPAEPFSAFQGDRLMFLRDMGVPLDFEALRSGACPDRQLHRI